MQLDEAIRHYIEGYKDRNPTFTIGPPAPGQIERFSLEVFGLTAPADLSRLYSLHDGVGFSNSDGLWWDFVPLANLRKFVASVENSFLGTHPELENRFFPFFDLSNGDVFGYLKQDGLEWGENLFSFDHESFEHSSEQRWEEFLVETELTLTALLQELAEESDE